MGDEPSATHQVESVTSSLSSSLEAIADDSGAMQSPATSAPSHRKRSSSLSTAATLPVADTTPATLSTPVNDDRRLMTRAINEGDLDEVRRLLVAGADPNAVFVKLSMLQYATLHEDVEMMQVRFPSASLPRSCPPASSSPILALRAPACSLPTCTLHSAPPLTHSLPCPHPCAPS